MLSKSQLRKQNRKKYAAENAANAEGEIKSLEADLLKCIHEKEVALKFLESANKDLNEKQDLKIKLQQENKKLKGMNDELHGKVNELEETLSTNAVNISELQELKANFDLAKSKLEEQREGAKKMADNFEKSQEDIARLNKEINLNSWKHRYGTHKMNKNSTLTFEKYKLDANLNTKKLNAELKDAKLHYEASLKKKDSELDKINQDNEKLANNLLSALKDKRDLECELEKRTSEYNEKNMKLAIENDRLTRSTAVYGTYLTATPQLVMSSIKKGISSRGILKRRLDTPVSQKKHMKLVTPPPTNSNTDSDVETTENAS